MSFTGKKANKSKNKKAFTMPSPFVLVFFVLVAVVALSYFVPVSTHDPATGELVYNAYIDSSGNLIENSGPVPQGLWNIMEASVVGYHNSASVGVALLLAGAFIGVMNFTGSMNIGIAMLLKKLKGAALIVVMNLIFGIMGSVYGFWEEILPFSIIVIPMFVLAGYRAIVGVAVLFVGAIFGNMASVVNPFSTGVAVSVIGDPELTMGSGIMLRMIIFAALFALSSVMLVAFAKKTQRDPAYSMTLDIDRSNSSANQDDSVNKKATKRDLASIIVFVLMITLMLIGYIPWESIGGEGLSAIVNSPVAMVSAIPVVGDLFGGFFVTKFGEWGFVEFSMLFLTGAILFKFINRIQIDVWLEQFMLGAKDLLGVVLILALANGVAVIMGDSQQGMSVTFVYWISGALGDSPVALFAIVAVIAYLGIGCALQSTSGVAGISMPILGAVAAGLFATSAIGSVGGEVVLIGAFTLGISFMTIVFPGPVNLGVSQMYGIPFDKFLRLMLAFVIPLLLVGTVLLTVLPLMGFVS